jgi:hypothetical protein
VKRSRTSVDEPNPKGQWRPASGVGTVLGCVMAAIGTSGCPEYDESADGGESAIDLEGHEVRCCYSGYFDSQTTPALTTFCLGGILPCIDQTEFTDEQSLVDFCALKCTPAWDAGTLPPPPGQYYDEFFEPIVGPGAVTWFDACSAMPVNSEIESSVVDMNSCHPSDPIPFGVVADVAPEYGGFLRDGSSGIEVAGADITADYALAVHFALHDCQGGGIDGGSCMLVMSGFDMNLSNIDMSGGMYDYNVTAGLTLSTNAVAEVFFDECGLTECEGTFEFSDGDGNQLGLDLQWTQVNTSNSSTGHGEIHLGNDGGYGGVDPLFGTLTLDLLGDSGEIIFDGEGEDSLGGDFAQVWFGLYGYVERIDDDVGDCCSTHMTGGCSNDYIKACVWAHDPDCANVEWDAGCVTAIETYACGVCP